MIGRDAISISSAFSLKAWLSFLLLACSLLLQSPGGHAQNSLAAALQQQSEFLPVRDAYRLDGAVTGDGQLRLYWQIAEGYYLYQHMFKVMHAEASTPTNLSIDFPPALDKTDEFFGDVSVYYDEADLAVSLPNGEAQATRENQLHHAPLMRCLGVGVINVAACKWRVCCSMPFLHIERLKQCVHDHQFQ